MCAPPVRIVARLPGRKEPQAPPDRQRSAPAEGAQNHANTGYTAVTGGSLQAGRLLLRCQNRTGSGHAGHARHGDIRHLHAIAASHIRTDNACAGTELQMPARPQSQDDKRDRYVFGALVARFRPLRISSHSGSPWTSMIKMDPNFLAECGPFSAARANAGPASAPR